MSVLGKGNLGAEVRLFPRINTGVEYTDNLFLSNDNIGSEPVSEWITTITPGITMDITGRNAGISLSYDPGYTLYNRYSDYDYWRHAASFTGEWQPTRHLDLALTDDFLKTEDPVDPEDLTVRRGRDAYTRNTTAARADYRFGAENSTFFEGSYHFLDNEDPAIEDSWRSGVDAGVIYWFNIRWGMDAGAAYYRADYDESDDFNNSTARLRLNYRFNPHLMGFVGYQHTLNQFDDDSNDYKIYDGSVGFEYAISPTMDFSLDVHYFVRDFDETQDQAETPINFAFSKRFQRGTVGLMGEGGYDRTTVSAQDLGYYIYYGGRIEADYLFTRRISGDINAGYTRRDYKDAIPPRKDDVIRAGCGMSVQLLRWLSARLGYAYNSVESTNEADDYVENRGSLMFTIAPPQPYRF